jgi:hypothetical protein
VNFVLYLFGVLAGLAVPLALPAVVIKKSCRHFFIARALSCAGVVMPLFVFFLALSFHRNGKATAHTAGWIASSPAGWR